MKKTLKAMRENPDVQTKANSSESINVLAETMKSRTSQNDMFKVLRENNCQIIFLTQETYP
jgi:hypothetical protein